MGWGRGGVGRGVRGSTTEKIGLSQRLSQDFQRGIKNRGEEGWGKFQKATKTSAEWSIFI